MVATDEKTQSTVTRDAADLHPICVKCIHDYTKKMRRLSLAPEDGPVDWKIPCSYVFKSDIDPERITRLGREEGLSDDEILDLIYAMNPVIFAKEVLKIDLYEYQQESILCTSKKKVMRMSRRLGKTSIATVELLHFALFQIKQSIIVFAPFKKQTEKIFQDVENLARRGGEYVLSRIIPVINTDRLFKKSPLEMRFKSGCVIKGTSVGVQSADRSVSLRGDGVKDWDGNAGYVLGDEIDFLTFKAWEVINPIINEGGGSVKFTGMSTPIGKREQFYNMCEGPMSRFYKEIYRTIYDYPKSGLASGVSLKDYVEIARESCLSDDSWIREYLAQFGDEMATEFSYDDLMACHSMAVKYPTIEIDPKTDHPDYTKAVAIPLKEGNIRMVGIDWNGDKIGTRFIVIEYHADKQKYQIVGRYTIESAKFSQIAAIDMVRYLNRMFMPMFIYADEGFGSTQIQRLHEISTLNEERDSTWTPQDRNLINVKGINMNANTEVYDKGTRKMIQKENKPFMVEIAKGLVQEHALMIPKNEFDLTRQKFDFRKNNQLRENLVPSLLKFRKKMTPTGRPTWSAEDDHDAIAMALALMAFIVETSDFVRRPSGMSAVIGRQRSGSAVVGQISPDDPLIEKLKQAQAAALAGARSNARPADRAEFLKPSVKQSQGELDDERPRQHTVIANKVLKSTGRRNPFGRSAF